MEKEFQKIIDKHTSSEIDWNEVFNYFQVPHDTFYIIELPHDLLTEYQLNLNWCLISQYHKLSLDFIKSFCHSLNWKFIKGNPTFEGEIKEQFEDYIPIGCNEKVPESLIKQYLDFIDWRNISFHQPLSEDFIREFADRVDWSEISYRQKLSEDFIREFADSVDWYWISKRQPLSEDFIREFADCVDWGDISSNQKLSEDFIREFTDRVDWKVITRYYELSEDFIREFADRVDWEVITRYYELSEDFIREFADRVDWHWIIQRSDEGLHRLLRNWEQRKNMFELTLNSSRVYRNHDHSPEPLNYISFLNISSRFILENAKIDLNEFYEMEKYYLSYTPRQWFKKKINFDYIKDGFGEAFGEAFGRLILFLIFFALPIEGFLRETNEFMYKVANNLYVVFSFLFFVTFFPTLIIIYQCCRNKWFDFYPVK